MRNGALQGAAEPGVHPGPHPHKPSHPLPDGRRSIEWRSTPAHQVSFTSLPRSTAEKRFEAVANPAVWLSLPRFESWRRHIGKDPLRTAETQTEGVFLRVLLLYGR
ncbi:hypothetical protein GCM10010145_36110 [Streptomyces ruber]|uniref:Uncharacterized protein n=1 Tax=Streptomyces ruber TaxID=83378 RepID=A0A918BFC5_9ACTN|nr:hypothetical protein GCM10010145_36110 [Streptomyces ruber]